MPIWPPLARVLIRAGLAGRLPAVRALLGEGVAYLPYFSDRILASPNEELKAAREWLGPSPDGVVDLTIGAPTIDLPIATRHDDIDEDGYPPLGGFPTLRRRIAERINEIHRVDFDSRDEIHVTNGVSQAIGLALDTFVNPGDGVAMFDPSYFMYRLAAQHRRARIRDIPSWMEEGETRFHERELRRALRRARLIFVNSPANPTGGVLSRESLERIAWHAKRAGALIFSDEVYEAFHGGEPLSIAAIADARGRTIVANSFSKSHGLSGHRVGYIAANRHLLGPMTVTCLASCPFVTVASQRLALSALDLPTGFLRLVERRFHSRRVQVVAALTRAGYTFDRPSGAFFVWIDAAPFAYDGMEAARRLLSQAGVRVWPGALSGPSGRTRIRLSFAGEESRLAEGIERLKRFAVQAGIARPPARLPPPRPARV